MLRSYKVKKPNFLLKLVALEQIMHIALNYKNLNF